MQLEPASPGTAWVNLEGERLLAALPEDLADLAREIARGTGVGARPSRMSEADFPLRQGDACFFILESLEPEPVLRMLGLCGPRTSAEATRRITSEQAQAIWKGLAALPPAQLAARYAVLRNRLDALLQSELWPVTAFAKGGPRAEPGSRPIGQNRRDYLAYVQSREDRLDLYVDLQVHLAAFTQALKPYGLARFAFIPWLAPRARAVELAGLAAQGGQVGQAGQLGPERLVAQAVLPNGKRVEVKLLPASGLFDSPDETGQSGTVPPAGPDAATADFSSRREKGRKEPRFTSAIHEPGDGDLLAALLSLAPERLHGAFSRRT